MDNMPTYNDFKLRFGKTKAGMDILKSAKDFNEADALIKQHYNQMLQDLSPKPAPITQVMKPKTKMLTPNVQGQQPSAMNRVFGESLGIPDKIDYSGNAETLKNLGFQMPSKKQSIFDAIFSGAASLGSVLANDDQTYQDSSNEFMMREKNRSDQKNAFLNALMSMNKDNSPAGVKEFEYFANLSPEMQAKMRDFMKIKMNPLQQIMAGIVGNSGFGE